MPAFTFTSPDGKSYTVNGPDGATQEQAFAMLQQQLQQQPQPPAAASQPQQSTLDKALDTGKQALQSGGRMLMSMATGIPGVFADGTATLANMGAKAAGAQQPFPVMPSEDFKQRLSPVLGQTPSGVGGAAEAIGAGVLGGGVQLPGQAASGAMAAAKAADAAGGTAGMQSGNSVVQAIESTLARLPGGGTLVDAMRSASNRVSDLSDRIVKNLSGGVDTSPTGAGQVLDQQLSAAGARAKQVAKEGYDRLDAMLPSNATIPPENTMATLKNLTAQPAGASNTMSTVTSPKLLAIRQGLEKDLQAAQGGGIPYGALKAVRSQIGQQIDWGPFSTNPDNGALKLVYGSLSKDLSAGASTFGPKVAAEAAKVNADYAAAKQTGDVLESVISKAGGPEKVFTSLMNGTRDGSTTLDTVLSNIDPQAKKVLAASALQRMGRATAGSQPGVDGDAFSASSFLTNWNRMSPEARNSLFGDIPGGYSNSVTLLANSVAKLKAYSQILPNASNTAQAVLWGETASGLLSVLVTHDYHTAASLAGSVAGTKLLATALTNPQTTAYLAKQTALMAAKAGAASRQALPANSAQ